MAIIKTRKNVRINKKNSLKEMKKKNTMRKKMMKGGSSQKKSVTRGNKPGSSVSSESKTKTDAKLLVFLAELLGGLGGIEGQKLFQKQQQTNKQD